MKRKGDNEDRISRPVRNERPTTEGGSPPDWLGAALAFFAADEGVAIVEHVAPYRVRAANKVFVAMSNTRDGSVAGKPVLEVGPRWEDDGFAGILRRAAKRSGTLSRLEHLPGSPPAWYEVSITRDSFPGLGIALVYRLRDVTAREARYRELEAATERLGSVVTVAAAAGTLSPTRVPGAAAQAAAAICGGPAAICLRGLDGSLQVTASAGLNGDSDGLWSAIARDKRLPVQQTLTSGQSGTTRVTAALPLELSAPLASVDAQWVAAVPIEGGRGPLGVVMTIWRQTRTPRGPDLRAIECVAGQVALSLEHAASRRSADPLRAVLQALPHPVLAIDIDGRVTLANLAFEDRFGVPADSRRSLEQLLRALSIRTPEGVPIPIEAFPLSRALAGEFVRGGPYVATEPESGHSCRVEVSAAPVHDGRHGNVVGATSIWFERLVVASDRVITPTLAGKRVPPHPAIAQAIAPLPVAQEGSP
jgi:PAS domain-containing protein